ncbi:MAG: sodium:proton antiporter NhaD [Bacteroidia bacterium]|nr:sodium:proton antiporter NhaD [Bacteroidia bacterium]NNJ55683.1 sodium:proton antiporter NhaD [Bacteroidia bacterium]
MLILIIVVFVLGYAAIALEHPLKVDKAASALITGMLCWAIYVFSMEGTGHEILHTIEHGIEGLSYKSGLIHHLYDIASILFFLMGAMTIVELIDAHEGFSVITDKIKTNDKTKLLWIICILTFFFSAALDNLTTTIVMVSLLRKLVSDKKTRWMFVGMVVIAANAGGAWSPIGDVTTTMLWIKGQLPEVTNLVRDLFLPSLAALLVPLTILSFTFKGTIVRPEKEVGPNHYTNPTTNFERNIVFAVGVLGLLFVPVFKTATHLPPFMGMMLSLGILWILTELLHSSKNDEIKHPYSVIGVLQKIDVASVLFFLGILLAVSALQEVGHLNKVAGYLDTAFQGDIYLINIIIGLLSSIVDNVPLVAAAQGMYPIEAAGNFAANGIFWEFLAYCAGTGGSALIIGSAAGVAAMGLEKIDFGWYVKKISLLAISGYFAGALVYYLMF